MADGHQQAQPGLRAAARTRPDHWIRWGAGLSIAGIVGALTLDPTFGGLTLLGGVALSLFGLHRLGRGGAN